MKLEISMLVLRERVYKDFLRLWSEEVQKALVQEKKLKNKKRLDALELGVVFIPTRKAEQLNQEFRGVPRATDVLSFDGDGLVSLGELVFCMEEVKKKAKKANLSIKHYLCLLLTHGILHLLGYEHEEGGQKEREMFRLQDKIMRKVAAKLAPDCKTAFDVL